MYKRKIDILDRDSLDKVYSDHQFITNKENDDCVGKMFYLDKVKVLFQYLIIFSSPFIVFFIIYVWLSR